MKEYWPPCNNLSNTGVLHPSAKPPCNGDACSLCLTPTKMQQQLKCHFEAGIEEEMIREMKKLMKEEQLELDLLDSWETHQ